MTNRVVLDPKQSALDPGVTVTGQLSSFGYEAGRAGLGPLRCCLGARRGNAFRTRRFEAREPADGTATDGRAGAQRRANRVAMEVAQWVGSLRPATALGRLFDACS